MVNFCCLCSVSEEKVGRTAGSEAFGTQETEEATQFHGRVIV